MKRAVMVMAVAVLCVAASAVAEERNGMLGSGSRTEEEVSGPTMGSGNLTSSGESGGGTIGSGTRSGGLIGSGTRQDDGLVGSGGGVSTESGGYFGSGLQAREYRLFDGVQYVRVLVVSSAAGTFVLSMAE